ncbi:hypothetical protein [Amycolatopsis sp.]|uniref:hypothetical protein n=1 Tax=Amycolatopsis sp. TaxID=37632 RepID=UPI002C6FC28B|nr:hypothetical protein [Amycolatopsis sp.]HVV13473.1 hypothetical protein [Amycolatopsis sp.]
MSKPGHQHTVLRTVRGCLLALSSGGLAITAHALGGGGFPDASLTLLLTALVGWTGAALAEKTRGPLGVLAVLGSAQLAMHLVLTELMDHHGPVHAAMYAAHAAATVLTGLLLAHAETMLRAAAATLWLLLPVVWRSAPIPAGPDLAPAPAPENTPLITVVLSRVHGTRGPPAHS